MNRFRREPFEIIPSDYEIIAEMPPLHRDVLLSSATYKETALFLGVPDGTVKSRKHRARAKLIELRNGRGE